MSVGLDADVLEGDESVLWLAVVLKDMSNEVFGVPVAVPSASLRTSYAFVGLWVGGNAGLLLLMMILGATSPSDATLFALLMMGLSPATIVLSGIARPVLCLVVETASLPPVAVGCVSPISVGSAGTCECAAEPALDSVPVSTSGRGSIWTIVVI